MLFLVTMIRSIAHRVKKKKKKKREREGKHPKYPLADVSRNRCSRKFCKIYKKISVLKSLFNKAAGDKKVHHKCFPMIYSFATLRRKQISKVT